MKTSEFILALTKHRQFGWILKPYGIQKIKGDFYTITENILAEGPDYKKYDAVQQKLIHLTNQCTEKEISKLFSKQKVTSREFKAALDEKSLMLIRDYIERRLIKTFNLLRETTIRLFYYADSKNFFDEDRIEIVKGTTRAIFNFIKEENGSKYFLSINDGENDIKLSGKPGETICNTPCILLASHRLYFFDAGDKGIDGKKLLPFFKKDAVIIPKSAEEKYFETFVKNSLENYDVQAEGFDVVLNKSNPVPILFFENDWKGEFVLILKFDYQGLILSYTYEKKAFVDFHNNNGTFSFTKTTRNIEFENQKRDFLISFPEIDEHNMCNYKIKPELAGTQNLLNWMNINSESLSEQGFVIRQNFHGKTYFTNQVSIHFTVKDKNDWFDVYAIVRFGEYSFPFIELKNNLLRNIREYMLPNGEIVLLPDEWFSKYAHLFQFGKTHDKSLSIQRQHIHYFYNELKEHDVSLAEKLGQLELCECEKPAGLLADFRNYQKTGYNWIYTLYKNKLGVCLADDMGLGKTLQTLAAILKFAESPIEMQVPQSPVKVGRQLSLFSPEPIFNGHHSDLKSKAGIIVMPTSLIHNWVNEIQKFAPTMKYYIYSGSRRVKDSAEFDNYQVILTSYGILRNDIDFLKGYFYHFIILDESQNVKNPFSKSYQTVKELEAGFKMVLTGTPIENSLSDLWAQLNIINPGLLGSHEFFKREFADPIEKPFDEKEREIKQLRLQKLISPFILRRTKQQVIDDLPELTESVQFSSMHEKQSHLYEEEKSRIRNAIMQSMETGQKSSNNLHIIKGITKLRQLANHPRMIDPESELNSGKFEDVMAMMDNIIAENHKVLIFSSFVKHLNIFATEFDNQKWPYAMLTGATADRESQIEKFQKEKSCRIFLISLKAGGVGLNLTAADYVFFLDPWWNPAAENQALSRAHRIGQKNKVMVYRFITENSIEQKIQKLQGRKKDLADVFINTNNPFKRFSEEELLELFD
jgi:SNF2 family DNA or RNA helicase